MAEILIKPQVEDSISVISPKNSKMNLSIDEISLNGVKKYDGINEYPLTAKHFEISSPIPEDAPVINACSFII